VTRSRTARLSLAFLLAATVETAAAHPMGNFSISHYAAIRVNAHDIEIKYLIDMAEIPTFQELQGGLTANPKDPALAAYLIAKSAAFGDGLQLAANGRPLTLRTVSESILFPPGAGNLPTMKVSIVYRVSIAGLPNPGKVELIYRDTNFPLRAGWKEIVATAGAGVQIVKSTAATKDRSAALANYPTDLLTGPPQDIEARIVFSRTTPGPQVNAASMAKATPTLSAYRDGHLSTSSAPLHLEANRQATPRNAFTELVNTRRMGFGILLMAAAIAAGLGALHALEPGHGKTIVAAYLVGSRGTARHAVLLGTIVTVSHTAGVYALGAVTLYAQQYVLPEQLYPYLGVLSGILIAGMGSYLFLQRFLGGSLGHAHNHGPGEHHHSHGGLWHSHGGASRHSHSPSEIATISTAPMDRKARLPMRQLLILGITGGMVPCPAALVVLLSAFSLHRPGFGLFLIVAFSMGLAAVLIVMGLIAIYARRMMSRLPAEGPLIQRWLPLASAVMITVLGLAVAVRGLMAAGVLHLRA
jgi:ABC-type nickel/cobalt efflux system permease component RcnA